MATMRKGKNRFRVFLDRKGISLRRKITPFSLEDAALVQAIDEGMESGYVSKKEVLEALWDDDESQVHQSVQARSEKR